MMVLINMRYVSLTALLLLLVFVSRAQTPPKTESDVLLLNDGEKLIGHLIRSTGGSVRFKSDILGEVSVDWGKIKELHSAGKFAVITKDTKIGRKGVSGEVP